MESIKQISWLCFLKWFQLRLNILFKDSKTQELIKRILYHFWGLTFIFFSPPKASEIHHSHSSSCIIGNALPNKITPLDCEVLSRRLSLFKNPGLHSVAPSHHYMYICWMKGENDRKGQDALPGIKTLESKTHELQPTAMIISLASSKSLHCVALFVICWTPSPRSCYGFLHREI